MNDSNAGTLDKVAAGPGSIVGVSDESARQHATRGEGGAIVGEAAVPAAMANRRGAGVADWPSPARGGKMGTAREAIGDSMRNPETGKLTPAASRIGKAAGVAVGGTVGHAIPIPGAGYGGGVIGYELGPTIMERMFPESAERTSIRQVGQDELLRQKSLKNPAHQQGSALDLKDAQTEGHCQRVTAFTICIAKAVPVPLTYLPILARAAFVHDIGKMAIPDSILRKPGPLDNDEKQIMRTHCKIGYNTVTRIPFLRDAADCVLAHHECFDGTGYPRGLRGEQIPLGARIISVANALDAMLSDWPYRNAHPMSHVHEEIPRCAGTQFDPKIVEAFLTIPENHWIELRENLDSPFRLASLTFSKA